MTAPKTPTRGRQTRTPPVAVSQVRPADFTAQRERLGLTQHQLAEMFGYTRQQIGNYESGRQPVPAIVALAMKGVQADAGNAASDRALQRVPRRGQLLNLARELAASLANLCNTFSLAGSVAHQPMVEAINLLDDGEILGDGSLSPLAINIAKIEGWGIFWVPPRRDRDGRWLIQRDDERKMFETDAAALEYVRQRAAEGSKLHRLALAIHEGEEKWHHT